MIENNLRKRLKQTLSVINGLGIILDDVDTHLEYKGSLSASEKDGLEDELVRGLLTVACMLHELRSLGYGKWKKCD